MSARRSMPVQKPGRSEQDVRTPAEFLDAVEDRFGPLDFDLAASSRARAVRRLPCYTPQKDALRQDWRTLPASYGLLWLNPPFGQIMPWATLCARYAGPKRRILLLTPASIDTEWYWARIAPNAFSLALRQRIIFMGQSHGFPKGLMLSGFGFGLTGIHPWSWK